MPHLPVATAGEATALDPSVIDCMLNPGAQTNPLFLKVFYPYFITATRKVTNTVSKQQSFTVTFF